MTRALSESQLIGCIRQTVQQWAQEEFDANGPEVPIAQRQVEHWESLIVALAVAGPIAP